MGYDQQCLGLKIWKWLIRHLMAFFTRKLMINHWIWGYILIFTHKVWPALNGDISWFNLSHLVVSMCFQLYFFIRDCGLYGLSSMFEGGGSQPAINQKCPWWIPPVSQKACQTLWRHVENALQFQSLYSINTPNNLHTSRWYFFLVGIMFWEQPLDHLVAEVSMCSPTQWYIAKTRRSYGAWFWWEHLQHIMATSYPGDPCN